MKGGGASMAKTRPKAKGTAVETAVARYAQEHGFPWAQRLALRGNQDAGDVSLLPGQAAIIECKAHAVGASGQPAAAHLRTWLSETETERVNAGADVALLVVKRSGTTDPGRWWCYLRIRALVTLIRGSELDTMVSDGPVCLALSEALTLLRAAGYGDPVPAGSAPQIGFQRASRVG